MNRFANIAIALAFSALPILKAQAGVEPKDADASVASVEKPGLRLTGDFDLEESYVNAMEVRREGRSHDLDEDATLVRAVFDWRTSFGNIRTGAEWNRDSFGLGSGSPLPNTLQSISLVLGLDKNISDSIVVRFEAKPGVYAGSLDGLSSGDWDIPFIFGGSYIFTPDFQVVLGLEVDVNSKYPVLPGAGLRWKIAPHLVADAVLPAPALEYEASRALTLRLGAEFKGGTYRVDPDFGDQHGDPRLDRAIVTFSEVRAGGGLAWKIAPSLVLTGEGGAQLAREFDFYRANDRYRTDGVAAYGGVSLHGSF